MRFMAAVVGMAMLTTGRIAVAQTVETPVPFDSGGRVVAITPTLAERLHLAAPAWPAAAVAYREARLYSVDPGGSFVLVLQRANGSLERIPLTADERRRLGSAIDAETGLNGRPSAEVAADVVSEPAGNAFARHQTFLAATAYAPLAASLTDDATAGGAVYLAATGVSFFVSYGAAQSTPFTRAQSDLAGSLGLAAGGAGWLAGYAASGNSDKGVRAIALGSAILGTISGATLGRGLTDAEAHAATLGIETTAAATLAVAAATGTSSRTMSGAVAIAAGLGYPIGVKYPRRAGYQVTAGDVEATSTAALVGVLAGASALGAIDHPTTNQTAGFLAAGYVAGVLVGDLSLARPFNFSQSDATLLNIAALAGGLVGLAVPVVARSDNVALDAGAPAVGALLGMSIVAGSLSSPRRDAQATTPSARFRSGARLTFTPTSLLSIAARSPGPHSIARITF